MWTGLRLWAAGMSACGIVICGQKSAVVVPACGRAGPLGVTGMSAGGGQRRVGTIVGGDFRMWTGLRLWAAGMSASGIVICGR